LDSIFLALFWILPIPVMIFYHIKTTKLNFMYRLMFLQVSILITIFVISNFQLGFNPVLMSYYVVVGFIGLMFFKKKYDYPQAVSIVFNIIFLNLLYWESPTYIYTVFVYGIREAVVLHIFPIYSFFFLYTILDFKLTKENVQLLLLGFGFSCITLWFLVYSNVNIWYSETYLEGMYWFKEVVYSITRSVCLTILYYIFYNCSVRKKKKCN